MTIEEKIQQDYMLHFPFWIYAIMMDEDEFQLHQMSLN